MTLLRLLIECVVGVRMVMLPRGRKVTRAVKGKLANLKRRDYIVGNSDELVHSDWSSEWNELKNLEPLPDGHGSELTSE